MKILKIYLFFCFTSVLFTSCRTHTFVPHTQNVPLFTDKKQFRVEPTISPLSLNVNLAYSPIKHLGIITSLQAHPRYFSPEIGIGGYYPIQNKLILELYGGYSYQGIQYDDSVQRTGFFGDQSKKVYHTNIHANKYFGQLNIGLIITEKIELAFSAKVCYWDFSNYYYHYQRWEYDRSTQNFYFRHEDIIDLGKTNQITMEPSITMKVGGKNCKFMIQTGLCAAGNYHNNTISPYDIELPLFVRLGASINLSFNDKAEKLPQE